jgi:hypothetical protein
MDSKYETYLLVLATDLFKQVCIIGNSSEALARVADVLFDRLKGFALRISSEDTTQIHWDLMVFVYKYRK